MTTIEIEVTESVETMVQELRQEHGKAVVNADLTSAVQQAVREGYQQLPE